jgi:phosphoglycerate dehydrogenase-like enzyme
MKPLVISAPAPRTLELIFTPEARARLDAGYEVVAAEPGAIGALDPAVLARARYVVGQPPLAPATVEAMGALRCVFNVEGNLIDNMPYELMFARGVHVVTTGAVFAEPVAELGLGLALDLARGITEADLAFREGRELWGGAGNAAARLLSGSEVGLVGFGDLGRALARLLAGFRARLRAHDPWLPPSLIREAGVEPADLETVLGQSDTVFVVAAATAENRGFLGAEALARMRPGAALVLLSRAAVVDFEALTAAVAEGRIVAASDVFPEEPPAFDHPLRRLPGFLRSAHRAGALDVAFGRMGDMLLEDMALIDRGLPPMRCRRAERETVGRLRSRPVTTN